MNNETDISFDSDEIDLEDEIDKEGYNSYKINFFLGHDIAHRN
jgi:hypothetical protein